MEATESLVPRNMMMMWDNVEQQLTESGYNVNDIDTAIFSMTHSAYNELMLYHNIQNCTSCPLHKQCAGPVTGAGVNRAPIMIIAEAPGEHEDRYGIPLIGVTGTLLTLVLSKLGVDRSQLYITNAVKCRPPQNREPLVEEIEACEHHLFNEIQIVKPQFIITLGNVAMRMLRGDKKLKISQERGKFVKYSDANGNHAVMHTYHPSYVLRQKGEALATAKLDFWSDLSAVFETAKKILPDYNFDGSLVELRSDSNGTDPSRLDRNTEEQTEPESRHSAQSAQG